MNRIVDTIGSKNGRPKKLLFGQCVVTGFKKTSKGTVMYVKQTVTPYYNYGSNTNEPSFFKTGRSLMSRYGNAVEELKDWSPYDSTIRYGRCFITNDSYFTEGMELHQDFHIKNIKTNYPTYPGHKCFMNKETMQPILDAKGDKIYYTPDFLDHYEEDVELGSEKYIPEEIQQIDNQEALVFEEEELALN